MSMLRVTAALALAGAVTCQAAELGREDFAYSVSLTTEPGVVVHRLMLPLDVYRHTVHADLADIRVFNADGGLVPYALRRPAAASQRQQAPARLPLFPLHGDATRATQALRLSIRTEGADIRVQGAPGVAAKAPVSGFLLDARSLDAPIAGLTLEWPEHVEGFSAHFIVEASNDLADWRTIAAAAPIVDLRYGDDRLVQRRLEFPAAQAKFWRLRWSSLPGPTVLTGVLAERTTSTVEGTRLELAVDAAVPADRGGEYEFDLGVQAPVDRINLRLPELNTVVEVELLSRTGSSEWQRAWSGTFYRLQAAGGEITNPFVVVPVTTDRYWLARVRQEGGGLGAGMPRVVVRWLPHEVLFVARGQAPFELVYGSSMADTAATELDDLLPRVELRGTLPIADARAAAAPREAGGPARLEPLAEPLPWRTIVLWTVLILAVAMLGGMAWRLSRQLQEKT